MFDKITDLPTYYYISLFAITLLFIGFMVFDIISFKIKSLTIVSDIKQTKKDVLLHQGCHIENLPIISDIFDDSSKKLRYAFESLLEMSQDLYQKKWIPNPASFFNLSSLLDSNIKSKLSGVSHFYYVITGFFVFILFNASNYILLDDSTSGIVFAISLIPLILSFLLTVIFSIEKSKIKLTLLENIDFLNESISLKLPVFSKNNGMSILVNQFLEYDRNMSMAVNNLSEKIDRFVMEDLKEGVSRSIEKTLLESVAPSIERANDAIIALSKDVSKRETDGMKELALNFSNALTTEFSYQFSPLVEKISEVSNTLSNSKNYLDIVSTTLESYKENLSKLNESTFDTLKKYEEAKSDFSKDVHLISDSVSKFNDVNENYQNNIASSVKQLESSINSLQIQTSESDKTLKTLLDGIFVEARNAEEQAGKAQELSLNQLQSQKQQFDSLLTELGTKNNELISGLEKLMDNFLNSSSEGIIDRQDSLSEKFYDILTSIDESTQSIKKSAMQLKNGFDELEAARIRAEEEQKNKKGFFRRSK